MEVNRDYAAVIHKKGQNVDERENKNKIIMNKIKAALFDLDGTLLDSEPQYTEGWKGICEKCAPGHPEYVHLMKGKALTKIMNDYFPGEELQKEVFRLIDEFESGMRFEFFPGALEFVNELRLNGVKCAVVTSSNSIKMGYVRKSIPGFDNLFDAVVTAGMYKESKPSPDCFLTAAALFGAAPQECVVFEDAYSGLEAGMASGCTTIGMVTSHSAEELQGLCHHILPSYVGFSYAALKQMLGID